MASLERLLAHLDMAHDDLVQGQEQGKLDALLAVLQYLKDAGASPSQLLPLGALANDLHRPKVGNQKPLLASIREAVAVAAVQGAAVRQVVLAAEAEAGVAAAAGPAIRGRGQPTSSRSLLAAVFPKTLSLPSLGAA